VKAHRYDGAVTQEGSATSQARCAHCNRAIGWNGNPHRPFCSLACRLIDLGVWLDEQYRIPASTSSEDAIVDGGFWHDCR